MLTVFSFALTSHAEEVSLSEFQQKVGMLHSSPTFKGYFYLGTDDRFHYFTEEWDYKIDPEYEVKKSEVDLAVEFPLGERKLGFSPIEGDSYKVFFVTGGHKYFMWE